MGRDKENIGNLSEFFLSILLWNLKMLSQNKVFLKLERISPHATRWMKFEDITVNKISQSQKDKYCMIALI